MTREKSIKEVEFLRDSFLDRAEQCEKIGDLIPMDIYARTAENLNGVLKYLCPITRDQVEKMRGKYIPQVAAENSILWGIEHAKCSVCGSIAITENGNGPDFCCHCGSPMTDKAVDILWKRLEAMQDAAD